jgi:hypothetical protein
MIAVTAQQDFTFRAVSMLKGETRELGAMQAVILKAKGFVAYGRPEQIAVATPKRRRTYKRRDLTAEAVTKA